MAKSWEKLGKVANSGEKWQQVGKVMKSGKKWGKMGKSGEKWEKVGRSGESWKKWGKSWNKWGKVGKSGHFGFRFLPKSIGTSLYSMSVATSNMKLIGESLIKSYFHKMTVCGHFGFPIFSKIDRVLPSNMKLIGASLIKL